DQATAELGKMVGDLSNKSFLDIGCGSGIHSLAALRLGASQVVGFDYDIASINACKQLQTRAGNSWRVEQGSVLDEGYMRSLGSFDVVYSWGVLHHTGDMWTAMDQATIPCAGTLAIGIYNDQGFTSRLWRRAKRVYSSSGPIGQSLVLSGT